jgi:DNA-binding Xre family transcriptional regulator
MYWAPTPSFWRFKGDPVPKQPPKDEELLVAIGRNIAKLIEKRGYKSQEQFAWEIELPKTTLSRIIRGKGDVRISKLARIARALKVKVDELLKG